MKFARAEGVEGEIVVYLGVGWIVKGIAHPSDGVIAFPRYSLVGEVRKLSAAEVTKLISDHSKYWNYIAMHVPVVPPLKLLANPSRELLEFSSLIKSVIPNECSIVHTGSSAIGLEGSKDLDLVIKCPTTSSCIEAYNGLRKLRLQGLLKRSSGAIAMEWLERHRETLDFLSYLETKMESLLMGFFKCKRYTIRVVNLEFKPHKVERFSYLYTRLRILKPILDFTTPCRYLAYIERLDLKVILESYRLIMTHLGPGTEIEAIFRVELRGDGFTYAVPDHSERIFLKLAD